MKKCNKCGKGNKRFNSRSAMCRDCQKDYNKEWYKTNSANHRRNLKKLQAQYTIENREIIDKAKSVPCTDCGNQYPSYVMDFDHLDKNTKLADVSAMMKRYAPPTVIEEISKCEVVCSNCHRERTFGNKGSSSKR